MKQRKFIHMTHEEERQRVEVGKKEKYAKSQLRMDFSHTIISRKAD
jgi:hypothetical protein